MFKCGCKNEYNKDMCLVEIGLRAPNMTTIIGSIVNIIWRPYMIIHEYENLVKRWVQRLIGKMTLGMAPKKRRRSPAGIQIYALGYVP